MKVIFWCRWVDPEVLSVELEPKAMDESAVIDGILRLRFSDAILFGEYKPGGYYELDLDANAVTSGNSRMTWRRVDERVVVGLPEGGSGTRLTETRVTFVPLMRSEVGSAEGAMTLLLSGAEAAAFRTRGPSETDVPRLSR